MEEVVLGATAAGGLRGCGRPERRRPSQCRPVCVQVEGVESNDGGALPVTRSRHPQHTGRRHAAVRPQVLLARGQHDRSPGGLVLPEHQVAQADRRHQAVQQGGGSKRDGWLPNGGSEEVPGLASAQMGGVERVPHSAGR